MLQLEKIKNFIDKNEQKVLYRNEGHKLDFFKTSDFKLKKTTKGSKVISLFFWSFYIAVGWSLYSLNSKNEIIKEEVVQGYNTFSEIYKDIDEKNTIDIDKFESLSKYSSASSSLLASTVIQKILFRDSSYKDNKDFAPELYKNYKPIDPKVKEAVFKIFLKNWNYGLEKEKKLYSNCGIDIICHYAYDRLEQYHDKMNDLIHKQVIYVKHPDIFEKQLELTKLQVKYQSFY